MTTSEQPSEPNSRKDWTKVKLERFEGEKNKFYFRDGDFKSLPLFFHFVRALETIPAYSQGECRIYLFDPNYDTNITGDPAAVVNKSR